VESNSVCKHECAGVRFVYQELFLTELDNRKSGWFFELSDNNCELEENRSFFKPITIEEIVVFIIIMDITKTSSNNCSQAQFFHKIISYNKWLSN